MYKGVWHPLLQKQACMALRNLVARTRDNCQNILEQGAEAVINDALQRHSGLQDEAKAALRDLGCKVELKERWKGEKGQIVHWYESSPLDGCSYFNMADLKYQV